MRLGDLDALKEDFKARLEKAKNWKENALNNSDDELVIRATATIDFICEVIMTIDNAPTVEYPFYAEAYQTGYEEGKNARPKGEWLSDRCGHFYKCSICGREIETEAFENPEWNYPFCHCGADMRKGGAE